MLIHGYQDNIHKCKDFHDDAESGETYFSSLLPIIEAEFADEARIMVFTYPTFNAFGVAAAELALQLNIASHGAVPLEHVVLIGHSMGGLVAREATQILKDFYGKSNLVDGVITLASPHRGLTDIRLIRKYLLWEDNDGSRSAIAGIERQQEEAPIYAFAGALTQPQSGDKKLGCAGASELKYAELCAWLSNPNDGLVEDWSSRPYFIPEERRHKVLADYDHSEMKDGDNRAGYLDDQLFRAIIADMRAIFPVSASEVLFAQPYYGSDFSVAGANPVLTHYVYVPFSPIATTAVFPTSQFYTLTAEIKTLRIRRVSGVACSAPVNITLLTDLGNSLGSVWTGVASGVDYCDFPVTGTAIGKRFAGIAFCVNGSCNNSQGDLVLSGASINDGAMYSGVGDSPVVGGPAFQLCGALGCDDSFVYFAGRTPPAVALSATAGTVSPGQTTSLTWSSTGATSCSARWTTSTAASGTQVVAPLISTKYPMVCTGAGGATLATTTVTVVVFAQPYYGSDFSVAGANPGLTHYVYVPFSPIATTADFPTSKFHTLTAEIKTLRIRRVSGVACSAPVNINLLTDLGNGLGRVWPGVASGVDYCDFPVTGTAIGNRFAGIIFCVNASCTNSQGDLVLSGASINDGAMYSGAGDSPVVGGPAFQLCAGACDESFIHFAGGTLPTVVLSAIPSTISAGQSTTLTWSATGATSCAAPWTTSTSTTGTQLVTPAISTTYTMVCTGAGGATIASAIAAVQ